MKKLLLLILVVSAALVSWQQVNSEDKQTEVLNYEKVGQLHNEGLDYILEQIKDQPKTKGSGIQISVTQICDMTDEFLKLKGFQQHYSTKSLAYNVA